MSKVSIFIGAKLEIKMNFTDLDTGMFYFSWVGFQLCVKLFFWLLILNVGVPEATGSCPVHKWSRSSKVDWVFSQGLKALEFIKSCSFTRGGCG